MKNILGKKARGTAKKGNVMTPLTWMCGISEMALFYTATLNSNNWLGITSFILAALIIFFYGTMYVFYSIKDPDRLQSEEYNLYNQEMRLLIADDMGRPANLELTNSLKPPVLGNAIPTDVS